jgi:PIN domain nuclease of toxin-antitoxin system
LENRDNELLFSAASIWEMSIKAAGGGADFPSGAGRDVEAAQATGLIGFPHVLRWRERSLRSRTIICHAFDHLVMAKAMTDPAARPDRGGAGAITRSWSSCQVAVELVI